MLRVILVEDRLPRDEQSLDREPGWRQSPTMVVLRSMHFFPGFAAIPTCDLAFIQVRSHGFSGLQGNKREDYP